MNSSEALTLTGSLIQNETAIVALTPQTYHDDGIDLRVSIRAIEYFFSIDTFFYGHALQKFLEQASEVIGGASRVVLVNYDETLLLEFVKMETRVFLSLSYSSILPEQGGHLAYEALKEASSLDSLNAGSRFSFSFLPLHNTLLEITD
jgi:hypothetical protein